jgi:UDP:flavonoid glycosyltransferase YjiC (YdhE family)
MLVLALALRARGHQIRFLAAPNFETWATGHGLSFRPLGRDIQAFLASVGTNIDRALRTLRDDLRLEFQTVGEEVPGADLIIGASVIASGVSHGEKLGIPYLYTIFSPSLLPSAQHPSPTCPIQGLPRWMNRLTWWATRRLWNTLFLRKLDQERARLGLPGVRDTWGHIQDAPILLACDPALATPAPDAPARLHQPGALFLPESESLPPELERFLDAGPPPVYIGFGSMPDRDPAASTALIRKAVRAAGVRAVVSRGWAGLGLGEVEIAKGGDPDLCVVDAVPHGKLFPRVAAVVHHGGSGTTASAARAGVPQLVIPHLLDQFFWGQRIATLGVGPRAIPRRRLTARRLAEGLHACLGEAGHARRARLLAPRITDGVDRAVATIEALASAARSVVRPRPAEVPCTTQDSRWC